MVLIDLRLPAQESFWLLLQLLEGFPLLITVTNGQNILKRRTYISFDLSLDWYYDFVNASPFVCIFCAPSDDAEAFKNVDNVVDATPLYAELARALVQK